MYFKLININIGWQLVYFVSILLSFTGLLPKTLNTFIVSTLFFLLPIGIGLWLIPRAVINEKGILKRTIIFPTTFLVGLVVITALFVARERIGLFTSNSNYLFYVVIVISVGGFITRNRVFHVDKNAKDFGLVLLAASPVFIVLYSIKYYFYSKYPVTDLFQMTHFMKGAEEFSRYDILNPFTANSYIPAFQVMFGVMRKYFYYEILEGLWYLPLSYFLLQTAVYHALAQQMLKSEREIIAVVIGLTIYAGVNVISNSAMVELMSITLLSILLIAKVNCAQKLNIFLCAIVLTMSVAASIIVKLDPVVIILAICVYAVLFRFNQGSKNGAISLIAALLPILLIPLHREAVMIIPVIVGLIMWFNILERNAPLRRFLIYVIPISIVFMLLYIFVKIYMAIDSDPILDALAWIVKMLLGIDIITNLESRSGLGGRIAIFELARTVGFLLTVLVLYSLAKYVKNRNSSEASNLNLDWLTLLLFAGSIVFIILLGLPFMHRLGYLLVAAIVILIVSVKYSTKDSLKLLIVLSFILLNFMVMFSLKNTVFSQKYAILFWGLVILVSCALVSAYQIERYRKSLTLFSLLFIGILDRGATNAYFQEYVYNNSMVDSSRVISHYSKDDLVVANYLKNYKGRLILFSDPHTMAIISALTGHNKIATYSNIDSMPNSQLASLKRSLYNLVGSKNIFCSRSLNYRAYMALRDYLFTYPLGAELNYFVQRVSIEDWSGNNVLNEFDKHGGFIVSHKLSPTVRKNSTVKKQPKYVNAKLGIKNSGLRYLAKFQDFDIKIAVIISSKTRSWLSSKTLLVPPYFSLREKGNQPGTINQILNQNAVKFKNASVLIVSVKSLISFVKESKSIVSTFEPQKVMVPILPRLWQPKIYIESKPEN